jgi:hypothetical protein
MVCEPVSESAKLAKRRYQREMAAAAAVYVGVVFAAAFAIRNFDPPQWLAILAALAPVAPALMMLRAYLVYSRALDEFQRRLQTEALIVAAAVVVFGSFAYGFLEEWAEFPHVPLIWVFPAFSVVFGLAHILIRRRYK